MAAKSTIGIFNNTNGKLRIVEAADYCSACGACMSYSDLFEEDREGKCRPKNKGIIAADDLRMAEVMEAVELCPEQALFVHNISLVKGKGAVTVEDLWIFVHKMLVEYTCPLPDVTEFRFVGSVPYVDGDGVWGLSSSEYSSRDRATRAGLAELKRVYFNNMDTLMKGMLAEYKHLVLTPLLSYEETEDNCYYAEIKKISNLLRAIALEIKAVTGKRAVADIDTIKFKPNLGYKGKNFEQVADLEEWLYRSAQQDLENPDWYESFIDVDDWDTFKTDWFGNFKTVHAYKYRAGDASRKIEEHMQIGAAQAVEDFFYDGSFKYAFQDLMKPLEDEVRQKGRQLLELLESFESKKKQGRQEGLDFISDWLSGMSLASGHNRLHPTCGEFLRKNG